MEEKKDNACRGAKDNSSEEDESSEDSECDQVAELPKQPTNVVNGKPKARTSVSAEAFGKYNAKQAYTVKVIEKTEATKEK